MFSKDAMLICQKKKQQLEFETQLEFYSSILG